MEMRLSHFFAPAIDFGLILANNSVQRMPASVPNIYSPRYGSPKITWTGRVAATLVAIGCLAVLLIASQLPPDPSGEGTHTLLGLQRCQFLVNTGIPCLSCGMTTSFAYFAHGQIGRAFFTQPFGAVLAVLTCLVFWGAAYIAVTGRAAHRVLRFVHTPPLLWTLTILSAAAWAWKIFIHVQGWETL